VPEILALSWTGYDMVTFKIAELAPNAVSVQRERVYGLLIRDSSKG
jgi:hypothetical protein